MKINSRQFFRNRLTTLVVVMLMLLMAPAAKAGWWPYEKYAGFIRSFHVDRAWKFTTQSNTNTSGDGCGNIDEGTKMVPYPGFIAWSAMIWNEKTNSTDDHQLSQMEVKLVNTQTQEWRMLSVVHFDTSDDDDTKFSYTVAQNSLCTYALTRRYYKNHCDGSQFAYFMTEYDENLRDFIDRAGSHLKIQTHCYWDDNDWKWGDHESTVDLGDLQWLTTPEPSFEEIRYEVHDGETSLRVRVPETLTGYDLMLRYYLETRTGHSDVLAEEDNVIPGRDYYFAINEATREQLQNGGIAVQLRLLDRYTISSNYMESSTVLRQTESSHNQYATQPTSGRTIARWSTGKSPYILLPIEGSLSVSGRSDSKVRVEWYTEEEQTDHEYDQSDWEVELSEDIYFENATAVTVPYSIGEKHYSCDFPIDIERGIVTYYARVRRKCMSFYQPYFRASSKINTDYKHVSSLDVTPDRDSDGEFNGKIRLEWQLSDGMWPTNTRLLVKYGTSGNRQFDQNATEWVVQNVPACTRTDFELQVVKDNVERNSSIYEGFILPSSTPSRLKTYTVSKGYYNNRVELRWEVEQDADNYSRFIIRRKEYGDSNENYSTLQTVTFRPGELEYNYTDQTGIPGIYYEYTLEGYADCEEVSSIVTTLTEVGFSQPYGVVSGQIVYSGNQGVEGVTVSATGNDSRSNHSLRIYDQGRVTFFDPERLLSADEGCVELFFRPEELQTDYALVHWPGHMVLTVPDSLLAHHRFNHVAWSWKNGARTLFVDGHPYEQTISLNAESSIDSIFIEGVVGYLDEIRFWNTAHDSAAIAGTCSRYLSGTESGLKGYYRCDDPIVGELYDISRTGTRFNENHAVTLLCEIDADHTPTADQLSLKAVTDQNGNYLINSVPFTNDGSLYSLTPTMGIHEFSPASKPLFFNESTTTHNNIDFTDQSSFMVRGKVTYANTTVPVKGVRFKIDGTTYCTKDGEMISTDDNGEYEISVPIGSHFISVELTNHTFLHNGRYPEIAGQTIVVDHDIENLNFYDNTTVLLVGRVAGGNIEKKRPHGFGDGKCNIGVAEIVLAMPNDQQALNLEATQRNYEVPDSMHCSTSCAYTTGFNTPTAHRIVIRTDSTTGEFAVALPPVDLSVISIKLLSNPDFAFSSSYLRNLQLSNKPGVPTSDSLRINGQIVYRSYGLAHDIIAQADPTLTIRQGYDYGLGEQTLVVPCGDKDSVVSIYSLDSHRQPVYAFGCPIFQQNTYSWEMRLSDIYVNRDGQQPVYDTIPWEKGQVIITNEMDANGGGVLHLDETGYGIYTWEAGLPKLTAPYQQGMQITFSDSLGDNHIPWAGNTFQAILLGGKMEEGSDFVTMGPNKINYVLRCPPGKGSSATWKSGSAIKTIDNTFSHYDGTEEILSKTAFGVETQIGAGVGFFLINKITGKNNLTIGTAANQKKTWTHNKSWTTTTQTDLTIDRSTGLVGADADVYYGLATNRIFGICQNLQLRYNAETGQLYFGVAKAISTGDEISTTFQYSQYSILHTQIPNLQMLRDQYEVKHVAESDYNSSYPNNTDGFIYITTLDQNDPARYEKGNYMAIKPINNTRNASDSLTMYNDAINGWYEAIRDNEKKKRQAIERGRASFNKDDYRKAERLLDFYLRASYEFTYGQRTVFYFDTKNDMDLVGEHYINHTDDEGNVSTFMSRQDWADWKGEYHISDANINQVDIHTFYKGGYYLYNESVSGGVGVSNSVTKTDNYCHTTNYDFTWVFVLADEVGVGINGTGVVFSGKTTQGGGAGWTKGNDTTFVSTVAYTLGGNRHENYTVDVFDAGDGWGPVFYLRGGETYCPYEPQEVTKYYNPGEELSAGSIQMQQPQITASGMHHYAISDVPAGTDAVVQVELANIANLANKAAAMEMQLAVNPASNPHGLDVRVDGRTIGYDDEVIYLHCPEAITQTLTISQTDRSVNEYKDVAILLRSACQPLVICDTLWLSVSFVPECTALTLATENLTLSTVNSDTLPLVISGYDRNYYGLQHIRLERRRQGDTQWTTDSIIPASLITSSTLRVRMPFTSATWPDGHYEVRATTQCTGEVENSSNILDITKDMQRPTLLGSPEPSNGYYTIDNDLAINWSEPIRYATLSKDRNFRITGLLNAAEVDHSVAVDLMNESRTEASFVVNGTSFGCEMWLRSRSDGQILSFGGEACQASLDDRHLVIRLGDQTYRSTTQLPDDSWTYLYINIQQEDGTFINASAFHDDQSVQLFYLTPATPISVNGNITVGGDMQGEMHGLKLWSRSRDAVEAQQEMNQSPDLYTAGLTAYWPMNEGIGTVAGENQRSRQLLLPDNAWYLAGTNYAVQVNTTADIDITTANLLPTDEYVLEYWLRTDDATSIMAITTDIEQPLTIGYQAQSLFLSSPYTGANYSSPHSNLSDNEWHHFALSYVRNGYATIFIDGQAALTVPQAAIGGLRGGALRLSRGEYDEIRLWRGRIDQSLIAGRRYSRCQGNEAGLTWRFAFERDQVDSGQQHSQVFTLDESVDTGKSAHFAEGADVQQGTTCPPLQAAKVEEDVMFDFTSSDTRTVFTLTSDNNRLEGATLTCTAQLVPDVAGNLSEAISWQVTVNRCQLDWEEKSISLSMAQDNLTDISLAFRNNSGISDTWQLSGLPTWLTVRTTQGTIDGMARQTIVATPDPSLAPGYYSATLTLVGKQGVKKTIELMLHVNAWQPVWNVDDTRCDQPMNIIGQIVMPAGSAISADHLLGAFIGNECIGLANPQYFSGYGTFFVMMSLYSNTAAPITFRLWDSTTGSVYAPLTVEVNGSATNIAFQEGQLIGNLMNPVIFRTGNFVQEDIELSAGWNWISFYVEPESSDMSSIFAPVMDNILQIKDPTGFSIPDGEGTLRGSVRTMRPETMYKTRMTYINTLEIEGQLVDPASHPITIHPGWNWIGFIGTSNLTVKEALSGLSPKAGDVIKSRSAFSVWDGSDWVGMLRYMEPSVGYMYSSTDNTEKTLVYPQSGRSQAPRRMMAQAASVHYTPDVNGQYPTTMAIVAQVRAGEAVLADYEVGAFVGTECRGVSVADDDLLFISLEGMAGETISFRLYNTETGEERMAQETVTYVADDLVGTIAEPFVLTLGDRPTDILSAEGEDSGARKVIRDNRVFIIRDGKWWDVLGRAVEQ